MKSANPPKIYVFIFIIILETLAVFSHEQAEHGNIRKSESQFLQLNPSRESNIDNEIIKPLPENADAVLNNILIASDNCVKERFSIEEMINNQMLQNSEENSHRITISCSVNTLQQVQQLESIISTYHFDNYQLSPNSTECNFGQTIESRELIKCTFIFIQNSDLFSTLNFRLLSDNEEDNLNNDTSTSDSASENSFNSTTASPIETNTTISSNSSHPTAESTDTPTNTSTPTHNTTTPTQSNNTSHTNTTSESTTGGRNHTSTTPAHNQTNINATSPNPQENTNQTSTSQPENNTNTPTTPTEANTNNTSNPTETDTSNTSTGTQTNNTSTPPETNTNTTSTTPEDTDSKLFSLDLDSSTSTTLLVTGAGFVFLIVVAAVCYWTKRKNRQKKKSQEDRQKLVRKINSPTPIKVPELSPNKPKLPQQLLSSEPNTGMSPLNYYRAGQNLRLEENGRSSLVPDEIVLTNIDNSPRSVSEVSSLPSVRDAPKTLDFNIEFSMVEQESIMKIKKGTESKKKLDF